MQKRHVQTYARYRLKQHYHADCGRGNILVTGKKKEIGQHIDKRAVKNKRHPQFLGHGKTEP